jgi:hypothetical protein
VPTVTWDAINHNYLISISGIGSGCPVPQVTAFGHAVQILEPGGGSCRDGTLSGFAIRFADGSRGSWAYMFVGK